VLADVPGAADTAYSILVGCSAVVLLVRLLTTSGDIEAESVISLSERDAEAALRLLRDQPSTGDAVDDGAMTAAIRMLERNHELQRELAATVEMVRASRLRLWRQRRWNGATLRAAARPGPPDGRPDQGAPRIPLAGGCCARDVGDCVRQLDGIEVDLDASDAASIRPA
jgi:uncharacterized membrane protein YccC